MQGSTNIFDLFFQGGKTQEVPISAPTRVDTILNSEHTKFDDALYVKGHGIRTPRVLKRPTYAELSQFLTQAGAVLFRSEHTQDREGVSDIGRSSLYRELPSQERYADMLQNPYTYFQDYAHVSAYAKHYNIPVTKVKAGFGFSVWEYIEGQNITIAEDSSHRGRYHVMLQGEGVYAIIEDNAVVYVSSQRGGGAVSGDVQQVFERIRELVMVYQKVLGLPRF